MKELQQYIIQFLAVVDDKESAKEIEDETAKDSSANLLETERKDDESRGMEKEASVEEKGEGNMDIKAAGAIQSSWKLITFEQFLMTSSQLNQLFTDDILQSLLSLLPTSSPSSSYPLPSSLPQQLISDKKEQKKEKIKSSTSSVTSSLVCQFIPSSFLFQWNFLSPFQQQLSTIQHYSFHLINTSYAFYHHLLFVKNIYFLGKNDFYLSLKELCHFYVYFPTISSFSSSSSSSSASMVGSLLTLPSSPPVLTVPSTFKQQKQQPSVTAAAAAAAGGGSSLFNHRKSLQLITEKEFSSQEFHLLNNIQSSISLNFVEILPNKGIQSSSFHFPLMNDFFQTPSSSSSTASVSSFSSPSGTSSRKKEKKEKSLETIFLTIIQEMRFEIFYAWPLSNIFHSSFLSSLSSIHQFLLSLQVMKWFSEFYWKSIISGNSLLIEYNKQYQVINNDTFSEKKERKGNKSSPIPEKERKLKAGEEKPRKAASNVDDEAEEERADTERKIKGFIQIYDEEYDIIQAKRQIQYQLVLIIHLLKCLYDYSLTYIHEYLWKDFHDHLFPSSSSVSASSTFSSAVNPNLTISMIRYYLEEMVSEILSFLSLFQTILQRFFSELFQGFTELRYCLVMETQYFYQRQEQTRREKEEKELKNEKKERADPSLITKNQRLIAFRITEKQFEKLSLTMKKVYSIINQYSNHKLYYFPSSSSSSSSSTTAASAARMFLQERQKHFSMIKMKLFEEMKLRLQGSFD
jgi:hypothetical protein